MKKYTIFTFFVLTLSVTVFSDSNYVYLPLVAQYPEITNRPVRIMPFGNSITSSLPGRYSYRYFLWHSLLGSSYRDSVDIDFVGRQIGVYSGEEFPANPDFDQNHEGHPGERTDALRYILPYALQLNIPDIILIHAGTNDIQYTDPGSVTEANICAIIDTCRAYNQYMVILLARITPSASPGQLPAYNDVNNRISSIAVKKHQPFSPIVLVDINSDFNLNLDIDQADLVHLTTQGEQKMASRWFQALSSVLPRMITKVEPKRMLELFPRSGTFIGNQKIDITGVLRTNAPVADYEAYFDGIRKYGTVNWYGQITQDNTTYRAFILKDFYMKGTFGVGNHTFIFKLILSDMTSVSDTASYTILENR